VNTEEIGVEAMRLWNVASVKKLVYDLFDFEERAKKQRAKL
jgi:uncharacterized protein (DUF2384 family)